MVKLQYWEMLLEAGALLAILTVARGAVITETAAACWQQVVNATVNGSISALIRDSDRAEGYNACSWTINAPYGRRIRLVIVGGLSLAESTGCRDAYLSVYDGSSPSALQMGTWCGSGFLEPLRSSGNSMHIIFNDNTKGKSSYLAASYESFTDDDNDSCTLQQHECESNKACIPKSWVCDGQKDCTDGSDERSCGQGNVPTSIASTTGPTIGNISKSGCGGPMHINGESGDILSHLDFGVATYPESTCSWIVYPKPQKMTKLVFNVFDLENSAGCRYDSLRIYIGYSDQGRLVANLCGFREVDPMLFNETIYLSFKADSISNRGGFKLSYSYEPILRDQDSPTDAAPPSQATTPAIPQSGCGGPRYLKEPGGQITSANYGMSDYPANSRCEWTLEASYGKVVKIQFSDFRLEPSMGCNYDYVIIYDGVNQLSPVLARACGLRRPDAIFSTGTHMHIVFASDESYSAAGFNATFSAVPPPVLCQPDDFLCGDGGCVPQHGRCNGSSECLDATDEAFCSQGHCGVPSVSPKATNVRIFGGVEALPNSWPWQVMVRHSGQHVCGGSIISPHWVATAAHCFNEKGNNPANWSVTLGKHSKTQTDPYEYDREVVKIIEHPAFNRLNDDSDLALLKLDSAITFNTTAMPICLPSKKVPPGSLCYVTGWGETQGSGYPDVLKQAQVPTITNEDCMAGGWITALTKNQFCAGWASGGHDACQGDSGGPLSCQVNGTFELQGIVSFGIGCGNIQAPGVYTTVNNYADWIKNTIARNSV